MEHEEEIMMIGGGSKSGSFRKGSFRLGSVSKRIGGGGFGGCKDDKTVIQLGNIDTHRLLLTGERERHHHLRTLPANSLSSRQMKTLTALCDAILPAINDVAFPLDPSLDSLATFFRTSASMAGTDQRVGGIISEKLKHPNTPLLKLVVWLMSTWVGTLILCGLPCVSLRYPFIHTVHQLPLRKRRRIINSWFFSYFRLLRMLARTLKVLTVLTFFTQLDEAEENLAWKAIGYTGPDPEFNAQLKTHFLEGKTSTEPGGGPDQKHQRGDHDEEDDAEEVVGPLYKGLVPMNCPRDITSDALRRRGFHVTVLRRKTNKPPTSSSPSLVIQCDAVVVGSGSGGGLIAGVLAKAGYKVLVLEKGNYSARNNLTLLEGPSLDQMYLSNGLIATDDMGMFILAGSTVGGGSAINWSACIETPKHVRKEWSREHGLELFESKLYREALDVVSEKMGVQSEINDEGFNNAVLRRGCQEMGYPVTTIPRNSPPDHYCGWCGMGCKDGKKKGTSETWLVDLVKSGNGAILPSCTAIKVVHKKHRDEDRKTAKGVVFEYEYEGVKDICMVESKVTIVACGALCTPELLKRSGLKNKNIGKHLHLHPVTMAWGYFPDSPSSSDDDSEVWPEKHKKSYEGGIMTAMSTVVADFEKSGYGAVIQTPALHPGMFSLLMPWVSGSDMKERMRKFSRTAHVFALARDQGSGTVRSRDNISYKMKESDERNLQRGIEKVLRILAAAGAEEIGTHNDKGRSLNVKKVSYHEFEKFVKEESTRRLTDLSSPLCSAHQMGSCRMGANPRESAVNQMGETWEVEGLYVADSSVFPTALGVNPMLTVQSIAYCTAQSVLEVLRRKKSR
ncbi:hypothetical protein K1719_027741 [Acacia pycnantha]|nr:hypothetical protein K1719_027741 [Acacia pycnantha]